MSLLTVWVGVILSDGSKVRFRLMPIYEYMWLKRRWALIEHLMRQANDYTMNETMRRQTEVAARKNMDEYFSKLDESMQWRVW